MCARLTIAVKWIKMHKKNNRYRAFTLIELVVIIAIISILTAIVSVGLGNIRMKAHDARRVSDIKQVETALTSYYTNKGYYPEYTDWATICNTNLPPSPNSLGALVSESIMAAVPIDPINKSLSTPRFCYEYLGSSTGSYPGASSYYCDGKRRTCYEYSLVFSTEKSISGFPLVTGTSYFTNCIHGPLLPNPSPSVCP